MTTPDPREAVVKAAQALRDAGSERRSECPCHCCQLVNAALAPPPEKEAVRFERLEMCHVSDGEDLRICIHYGYGCIASVPTKFLLYARLFAASPRMYEALSDIVFRDGVVSPENREEIDAILAAVRGETA